MATPLSPLPEGWVRHPADPNSFLHDGYVRADGRCAVWRTDDSGRWFWGPPRAGGNGYRVVGDVL